MDMTSAIAAMSIELSMANVQSAASMKMLANMKHAQEVQGAQLVEMINESAPPMPSEGIGSLLDVRA